MRQEVASADLAAFEGDANVASNAEVSASKNCQVDVTSRTLEAKLLLIETEEENCGYAQNTRSHFGICRFY